MLVRLGSCGFLQVNPVFPDNRSLLWLEHEQLNRQIGTGVYLAHVGHDLAASGSFNHVLEGLLHRGLKTATDLVDGMAVAVVDQRDPSQFSDRDGAADRKSTRLNSSHLGISYAGLC